MTDADYRSLAGCIKQMEEAEHDGNLPASTVSQVVEMICR